MQHTTNIVIYGRSISHSGFDTVSVNTRVRCATCVDRIFIVHQAGFVHEKRTKCDLRKNRNRGCGTLCSYQLSIAATSLATLGSHGAVLRAGQRVQVKESTRRLSAISRSGRILASSACQRSRSGRSVYTRAVTRRGFATGFTRPDRSGLLISPSLSESRNAWQSTCAVERFGTLRV